MADSETLRLYADQANDYAKFTDAHAATDPMLVAFLDMVPKGGHILDLGCGPGASGEKMATLGYRVTGTDAVPEMVALANKRAGVTAHVATFDDIEGVDLYDGIWANFSLLHAAKIDMPRHLAALYKALKTGGALHIALKEGEGEHRDHLGRQYTYYQRSELSDVMTAAGFKVQDHSAGKGKGLAGTFEPWICVRAHG